MLENTTAHWAHLDDSTWSGFSHALDMPHLYKVTCKPLKPLPLFLFVNQLQSEWEAVSLELEQWVVCVRQLEDVLLLQTLLLVPPPQGAAGGAAAQCSIKALLEGGTGRLSP